jgi:hypothetical protein
MCRKIKEQVDEKCAHAHLNADSLLKNTSTEHSKYFVDQTRDYFDDVSFTENFVRNRVVFV